MKNSIIFGIYFATFVYSDIPDKGSLLFETSFIPSWLFGNIVGNENNFLRNNNFTIMYTDSSGNTDTLAFKNHFFNPSMDIFIAYHIKECIGIGLNYNYNETIQSADLPAKYNSKKRNDFLSFHQFGIGLNYSYLEFNKVHLGNYLNIHYSWGNIKRFGLITEYMNQNNQYYASYKEMSTPQPISGFGFGINQKIQVHILDNLSAIIGFKYDFTHFNIEKDQFIYSNSVNLNLIGLTLGLSFFTY